MEITFSSESMRFIGLSRCPPDGVWDNCKGTFTYASGNVYEGDWIDGKKTGKGTFTYIITFSLLFFFDQTGLVSNSFRQTTYAITGCL